MSISSYDFRPEGLSPEGVAAFITFQKAVGPIVKDSTNPHFRNKYAALDEIIKSVYPALNESGLAVTQTVQYEYTRTADIIGDLVSYLVTRLYFTDGTFEQSRYLLEPAKQRDPQAMGSAITYARRYTLLAILGLAAEDDDGNAASAAPSGMEAPPTKTSDMKKQQGQFKGSPNKPVSPAQQNMISNLVNEKLPNKTPEQGMEYILELVGKSDPDDLRSSDASTIIDHLKSL